MPIKENEWKIFGSAKEALSFWRFLNSKLLPHEAPPVISRRIAFLLDEEEIDDVVTIKELQELLLAALNTNRAQRVLDAVKEANRAKVFDGFPDAYSLPK